MAGCLALVFCALLYQATASAPADPTAEWPSPVLWTSHDVEIAMAQYGARVRCVVLSELGPSLDPYSVGALGERGPSQLASFGLLPEYKRLHPGDGSEWNPYLALDYLDATIKQGRGSNWTAILRWEC